MYPFVLEGMYICIAKRDINILKPRKFIRESNHCK